MKYKVEKWDCKSPGTGILCCAKCSLVTLQSAGGSVERTQEKAGMVLGGWGTGCTGISSEVTWDTLPLSAWKGLRVRGHLVPPWVDPSQMPTSPGLCPQPNSRSCLWACWLLDTPHGFPGHLQLLCSIMQLSVLLLPLGRACLRSPTKHFFLPVSSYLNQYFKLPTHFGQKPELPLSLSTTSPLHHINHKSHVLSFLGVLVFRRFLCNAACLASATTMAPYCTHVRSAAP